MPKSPRVHGSIKDKRVAPELVAERKNKKFDDKEIIEFLMGKEYYEARTQF